MSERAALLKKLSAYAFAAYDWNLYLDTHPNDTEAIKMYHKMADKADALRKEFEDNFGPLTAREANNPNRWNWLDDPWPWEKA